MTFKMTTDDNITHEVGFDWGIGAWAMCGRVASWEGDRAARRHEDREIDCMTCIAANAS